MKKFHISKKKANKIYDLLVSIGGASESERDEFVYNHNAGVYECLEWRFQGKLGFGGKYYKRKNRVNCYPDDRTDEIKSIIENLNNELSKLK